MVGHIDAPHLWCVSSSDIQHLIEQADGHDVAVPHNDARITAGIDAVILDDVDYEMVTTKQSA